MHEGLEARRAATRAILVALATTVALCGCHGRQTTDGNNHKTVATGAPCLPPIGDSQAAAADRVGSAHVYLDRSQSMAGYVDPRLGQSQALADLLRLLARELPAVASTLEYRPFGATIGDPLKPEEVPLFSEPTAYNCRNCDNQESHIDSVLDEIARTPKDSMHLMITDLWLDNRSFRGSDEVALGEPLRQILRNGRAVGLIGIQAFFRGPIYNVPGAGTYQEANERPLFLLMVGPPQSLDQVYRRLAESRSPALSPERLRYSLYSAAASLPPVERGVTARGRGGAPATVVRELRNTPQFRLALKHAERDAGRLEGTFDWAPEAQSTVWQGALSEQTRIWRLQSEDDLSECRPETWKELLPLRGAWRLSEDPHRYRFSVDHRLGARLPAPGTYYLLGELGVRGLEVPSPQTSWMEEWSVSPADAAALVQERPAVFKALNLGRFRTILDEELQRQRRDQIRLTRRTGFLLRLEP